MTQSRLGALTFLFGTTVIVLMKTPIIRWRTLVAAIMLFCLLYSIPAVLLGKGGGTNLSIEDNFWGIVGALQLYVFGGTVAFSEAFELGQGFPDYGMFRFFFRVASWLGWPIIPPPLVMDYTATPRPINVQTIYAPYFWDFGYLGVIGIMIILGVACQFAYERARVGNVLCAVLYARIAGCLMFTGANEMFFTGISSWVQTVVVSLIILGRISGTTHDERPLKVVAKRVRHLVQQRV